MTTELKRMYYTCIYEDDEELICYLKNWYNPELIKLELKRVELIIDELDKDYPTEEEEDKLEEVLEYKEFLENLF